MKKHKRLLCWMIIFLFMALPFSHAQTDSPDPEKTFEEIEIEEGFLPETYLIGPIVVEEDAQEFYEDSLEQLRFTDDLEDMFPTEESNLYETLIEESLLAGETPDLENVNEEEQCVADVDTQGRLSSMPGGGLPTQQWVQDTIQSKEDILAKKGASGLLGDQSSNAASHIFDLMKWGSDIYSKFGGVFAGVGEEEASDGMFGVFNTLHNIFEQSRELSEYGDVVDLSLRNGKMVIKQTDYSDKIRALEESTRDMERRLEDLKKEPEKNKKEIENIQKTLKSIESDLKKANENQKNMDKREIGKVISQTFKEEWDSDFIAEGLKLSASGESWRNYETKLEDIQDQKDIYQNQANELRKQADELKNKNKEDRAKELEKQAEQLENLVGDLDKTENQINEEFRKFKLSNPTANAIQFLDALGESELLDPTKPKTGESFKKGFGEFVNFLKSAMPEKNFPKDMDYVYHVALQGHLDFVNKNVGQLEGHFNDLTKNFDSMKKSFEKFKEDLSKDKNSDIAKSIGNIGPKLENLAKQIDDLEQKAKDLEEKIKDAEENGYSKGELNSIQRELADIKNQIQEALKEGAEISAEMLLNLAKMSQEMYDDWWKGLEMTPGPPCGEPKGDDPCIDPCKKGVYLESQLEELECSGAGLDADECPEFPELPEPTLGEKPQPEDDNQLLEKGSGAKAREALQRAVAKNNELANKFREIGMKKGLIEKYKPGEILYDGKEVKIEVGENNAFIKIFIKGLENKPIFLNYNEDLLKFLKDTPRFILPQLKKLFLENGFDGVLEAANEKIYFENDEGEIFIPTIYGLVKEKDIEEFEKLLQQNKDGVDSLKFYSEKHDKLVSQYNSLIQPFKKSFEVYDKNIKEYNDLVKKFKKASATEKGTLLPKILALKSVIKENEEKVLSQQNELKKIKSEIEELKLVFKFFEENIKEIRENIDELVVSFDKKDQNKVLRDETEKNSEFNLIVADQAESAAESLFPICPSPSVDSVVGGNPPAGSIPGITAFAVASQDQQDTDADKPPEEGSGIEIGPVCPDPNAENIGKAAIVKNINKLLALIYSEFLEKTKNLAKDDPDYLKLLNQYTTKMFDVFRKNLIKNEHQSALNEIENEIVKQKNAVKDAREKLMKYSLDIFKKIQEAKAKYLKQIELGNEAILALRELEFRQGKIDVLYSDIETADLPPELKRALSEAASTGYNEALRTRDEMIKKFQESNQKDADALNQELERLFGLLKSNSYLEKYKGAFAKLEELYSKYKTSILENPEIKNILNDQLKSDLEKMIENQKTTGLYGDLAYKQTKQGLIKIIAELMGTGQAEFEQEREELENLKTRIERQYQNGELTEEAYIDFMTRYRATKAEIDIRETRASENPLPSISQVGQLNLPFEYNLEGKFQKISQLSEFLWDDMSKAIFKNIVNNVRAEHYKFRLLTAEDFWEDYERLSTTSKKLFAERLDLLRQKEKASKEEDYRKIHDLTFDINTNKRAIDALVKEIQEIAEFSNYDDLRISALLSLANLMDDTILFSQIADLDIETKDLIAARSQLDPQKDAEQIKRMNEIIEMNLREIKTFRKDITDKHLNVENDKRIRELIRVMERVTGFEEDKFFLDFINFYKAAYANPKLEGALQNSQDIAEQLYFGFVFFKRLVEHGSDIKLPDGTTERRQDFSALPSGKIGWDDSTKRWIIENFGQEAYNKLTYEAGIRDIHEDFGGIEITNFIGEEKRLEAFKFFWNFFGHLYAEKGYGFDQPNEWASSYGDLGMLQYEAEDYIGAASSFYQASVLAEGELKSHFLLFGEGMEAYRVGERSTTMLGEYYLDPLNLLGAGIVSGLAKTGLQGLGSVVKFINRITKLRTLGKIGSGLDKAADWFRLLGQEGRVGLKDVLGKRRSLVNWLTHDFEKIVRLHFDEKTGKTIAYTVKEAVLAKRIKELVNARNAARGAKIAASAELRFIAKETGRTLAEIKKLGRKSVQDMIKAGLSENIANQLKKALNIQKEIKAQESFLLAAKELPDTAKGIGKTIKNQFGFGEHPKAIINNNAKLGEGAENIVFKGKIKGQEEVAIIVVKNPIGQQTSEQVLNKLIIKFKNEETLAGMKIIVNGKERPIAPKVFGLVDTGGNPGYARELIKGVRLADPQAAELINQNTYKQFKAIYQKLLAEGFVMDDFQFFIANEDQVINGFKFKKGDVVVFDAGELFRIDQRAAQLSEKFQRTFTLNDVKERFRKSMEQFRKSMADMLGIQDEPLKLPDEVINFPVAEPENILEKIYLRNILGETKYLQLEELGKLDEVASALAKGGPIDFSEKAIASWAGKLEGAGLKGVLDPEIAAEVAWAKAGGANRRQLVSDTGKLFASKLNALDDNTKRYAKRIIDAYLNRRINLDAAEIEKSTSKLDEIDIGIFFDDFFQLQLDSVSPQDIEATLFGRFWRSFSNSLKGKISANEMAEFNKAFESLRGSMVNHYNTRVLSDTEFKNLLTAAENALAKIKPGSQAYLQAEKNLVEAQLNYARALIREKKNAGRALFKGVARHDDVVRRLDYLDGELSILVNKNPDLRKTMNELIGIKIYPEGDIPIDAREGILWPSLYSQEGLTQKIKSLGKIDKEILYSETKMLASLQYWQTKNPQAFENILNLFPKSLRSEVMSVLKIDFIRNPAFYSFPAYLDLPSSVRMLLPFNKLSKTEANLLEEIMKLRIKTARGYNSPSWALDDLVRGKIRPRAEHSEYLGSLVMGDPSQFSGSHGPVYAIVNIDAAKAEGISLASETPFKYIDNIIVPNKEIAEGMIAALRKAERAGLLDNAAASAKLSIDDYLKVAIGKIKTYDEFLLERTMTSNPYYRLVKKKPNAQFAILADDPEFYKILEENKINFIDNGNLRKSIEKITEQVSALIVKKGYQVYDESVLYEEINELVLTKMFGKFPPSLEDFRLASKRIVEKNFKKLTSDEFSDAVGSESMGGNAGPGMIAVNAHFDETTGEILEFTNMPRPGKKVILHIHAYTGKIEDVFISEVGKIKLIKISESKLSKTAINNLLEAVSKYNLQLFEKVSSPPLQFYDDLENSLVKFLNQFKNDYPELGLKGEAKLLTEAEDLSGGGKNFVMELFVGDTKIGNYKIKVDTDKNTINLILIEFEKPFQGKGLYSKIVNLRTKLFLEYFKDYRIVTHSKNPVTTQSFIKNHGILRDYRKELHEIIIGSKKIHGEEMVGWVNPLDHGDDLVNQMLKIHPEDSLTIYSKEAAIINLERLGFDASKIDELLKGKIFTRNAPEWIELKIDAPNYYEYLLTRTTKLQSLEDIIKNTNSENLDEVLEPLITDQVKIDGHSVRAGISDLEATLLCQKSPESCNKFSDILVNSDGTAVGFGYRHAVKHSSEFEEYGGFNKVLEEMLEGQNLMIPSYTENILNVKLLNQEKNIFAVMVTNPEGKFVKLDFMTLYTANNNARASLWGLPENKVKSLIDTLEKPIRKGKIPFFVPLDRSKVLTKTGEGTAYAKLMEFDGGLSVVVLEYKKAGGRLSISTKQMSKASFDELIVNLELASSSKADRFLSGSKGFYNGINLEDTIINLRDIIPKKVPAGS